MWHLAGVSLWHGVRFKDNALKLKIRPTKMYTLPEAEALIAAISEPDAKLYVALTFYLPLRTSEAIALRWSDFSDSGVCIQRGFVNGIISGTKTGVVATQPLFSQLKPCCQRGMKRQDDR